MTREQRQIATRRVVTVAAVLLGIFFMHGMPGSVPGTGTHNAAMVAETSSMGDLSIIVTSGVAFSADAGVSVVSGEPDRVDLVAEAQSDDEEHAGMYLMGLCLVLLTIALLLGLPAACRRPWSVSRIGAWRPILVRSLPVRCRAPDLFALGVLRC